MPAVWAPIAGAVIGGLMGGQSGQTAPGVNPAMQLPGQAQIGQDLYGATRGYMGQAGQYVGAMNPQYANQVFNAMYANPYAGGMQSAANQAALSLQQLSPMAQEAALSQMGAGRQALGAGQQIWQTAQDPQQALYNRLANQTMQQANVANSQYGLGASAAGAGLANQAMTNMNLGWQNQQLARQIQGQEALGRGISESALASQRGLGMGQMGAGFQQQAGALPYQTAQGIAGGQLGAIQGAQGVMQGALLPYQQNIANLSSYAGLGQAGQAQANQQAYQQQQLQRQDVAALGQLGTQVAYGALGGK